MRQTQKNFARFRPPKMWSYALQLCHSLEYVIRTIDHNSRLGVSKRRMPSPVVASNATAPK
jgi:hypothetical protein